MKHIFQCKYVFILKQFQIIIKVFGGECLHTGLRGMDPHCPAMFCGNSVAACTQNRRPWIRIYPWISTQKSVDMDMDMDGKFHIHGKPGYITTEFGSPIDILG